MLTFKIYNICSTHLNMLYPVMESEMYKIIKPKAEVPVRFLQNKWKLFF